MNNLIELLGSLNKDERSLLEKNLEENPTLKRTELIRQLQRLTNPRSNSPYKDLGRMSPGNYQLVYETTDWLFSLILQQKDLSKFESRIARKRVAAYKYLLYSYVCIAKGIAADGIPYLKKAKKIAHEYEFLVIELEAINELIDRYHLENPGKKMGVLYNRRIRLMEQIECANEVQWIRHELIRDKFSKSNWRMASGKRRGSKIDRIMVLAKKSDLVNIKAYYYRTAYPYYSAIGDLKKALEVAKKYLNLAQNSVVMKFHYNIAGGNMLIATALNRMGKFSKALPHGRDALRLFGEVKRNKEVSSHVLFTSLFHLKKYDEADSVVKSNLRTKWIKNYPLLKAKWQFFEAAVHFKTSKLSESTNSLRESGHLMKDKTGWQYGYRILEILIQYENDGADILDTYINNFRRFIRKHKAESKTRIELILKVLSALEKSQFNFIKVGRSHAKMLKTLEEANGLYFYEPSGFEIVRFDQWFRKHLKKAK